jgi:hypothetical protein
MMQHVSEQVDKQMSMRSEGNTSLTSRLRSAMSLMWHRTTRRCGAQRASSVHLDRAGRQHPSFDLHGTWLTTCDILTVKSGSSLEQRKRESHDQCTARQAGATCDAD